MTRPGLLALLLPLGLAACLSLFGDLALFAGLVPQLDRLGLTLAQAGILLSVHRLIRIPGNPVAGLLMDRFGRRRLFLLGAVLAVVSSAAYALSRGFWPFLLARLAWGTAWALINVGGLTMILDTAPPTARGRAMGLWSTGILSGYIGGSLVGGVLIDAAGFRAAMLACAGSSLLGLLVAAVWLPETRPADAPVQSGRSAAQTLSTLWRSLLETVTASRAAAAALALYGIFVFAGDGVLLSTMTLLLQQRFGQQVAWAGLALGVVSASGALTALRSGIAVVAGPLAGHLSDGRLGRRPVILASLILGVAAFLLLRSAASLPGVLLAVLFSAVSGGCALAALPAYLGDHIPAGKQGPATGAMATAGDIGSTIGPALSFGLAPLLGLNAVYLLGAGLFLGGIAILGFSRPKISTSG